MAISNYTELQSAIAQWAHRSDLTSVIPDFIRIAESRLNRVLRTKAQDVVDDLTASTLTRFLALPARCLEVFDLAIYINGRQEQLTFVSPESFYTEITETSGYPLSYTVRDQLEFNCIPDSAYTVKLHYLKALDIATDTTNYVLTNYPDVYLWASLAAVEQYVNGDPRNYLAMLGEIVPEINSKESRSKSGNLVTELAWTGGFDINRG